MSSAITTNRRAGAIRAKDGRVYYAIFQAAYSSNVSPKKPSWMCLGFGRAPDMLRRIFNMAANICGGMLQARGRDLTTWGYITNWYQKLAHPYLMRADQPITLRVEQVNYPGHDWIARARFEAKREELLEAGQEEFVNTLDQGEYSGRLEEVAPALAILLESVDADLFFEDEGDERPKVDELGWRPKKAQRPPSYQLPGTYCFPGYRNVVEVVDGKCRIGPWSYAVKEHFVQHYAELELQSPGHYRKALQSLEAHLDNLPTLAHTAIVTVDPARASDVWAERAQSLWAAMDRRPQALWTLTAKEIDDVIACRSAVRLSLQDSGTKELTMLGQMAMSA